MFSMEEEVRFIESRKELVALLFDRFGPIPPAVIESIYRIDQLDTLQRLITSAATAPRWRVFAEELISVNDSYRNSHERFDLLWNKYRNLGEEDSYGIQE